MIVFRVMCLIGFQFIASAAFGSEPLRRIEIPSAAITTLRCSPDGERIVMSPCTGNCVYDVKKDQWIDVQQAVQTAVFVSNEQIVCFGSGTYFGEVVDLRNSTRRPWGHRLENGHWSFSSGVLARLENVASEKVPIIDVRDWDAAVPRCQIALRQFGVFRDLSLSQDGRMVAVITGQGGIEDIHADIYDTDHGKLLQSFVAPSDALAREATLCRYSHAAFGLGGKTIVLAGPASGLANATEHYESVIQVIDLKSKKERWSQHSTFLQVIRVKCSPSGRYLAVAVADISDDGRLYDTNGRRHRHGIKIFDVLTGREIAMLTGMTSTTIDIEFDSSESSVFSVASRDAHLYMWDIRKATSKE